MALKCISRCRILLGHFTPVRPVFAPDLICAAYSTGAHPDVLKTRKSIVVHGSKMSYLDTGVGDNIVVFLHGNPTSSYLWRNVIPHVQNQRTRCLAPDLIGMGHSDKLPDNDYTFRNHYKYLEAWVDKMALPEKVTIVCHDWGSGLGFHWCNLHRDRVKAIVHMESIVNAFYSWEDFPEIASKFFQALRSPAGEDMVLKKNLFVELLLPKAILRKLSDEEMSEYRRPFSNPGEDRQPTLTWPREIPVEKDGPQDVIDTARAYNAYLQSSMVPKLYIDAEPGFFSPFIRKAVTDWPNQKVIQVKGLHFLQEDSPDEIGKGIAEFLNVIYK